MCVCVWFIQQYKWLRWKLVCVSTDVPALNSATSSSDPAMITKNIHVSLSMKELKIRTICHARDLWKSVWPCKQLCLCPPDPWNFPVVPCSVDFKAPGELWNPLNSNAFTGVEIVFCFKLAFVPNGQISGKSALVQTMACHRTVDKPLSESIIP